MAQPISDPAADWDDIVGLENTKKALYESVVLIFTTSLNIESRIHYQFRRSCIAIHARSHHHRIESRGPEFFYMEYEDASTRIFIRSFVFSASRNGEDASRQGAHVTAPRSGIPFHFERGYIELLARKERTVR